MPTNRLPRELHKILSAQSNSVTSSTTERVWLVVACVAAGIGCALRCYQINVFPGLNADELEIALQWFRGTVLYWYVAPSGRPHIDPLQPLLLWPFATLASPAPWAVRMPALIAGVALMPVTFAVMYKAFDKTTALLTTLLVSSSPILIAYSRLGWDPGFVPVVTVLAVGFAFQRLWAWTSASMLLLALIHPTALFLVPIVATPFVCDSWRRLGGPQSQSIYRYGQAVFCGIAYTAIVLATVAVFSRIPLAFENVPRVLRLIGSRLSDGQGTVEFIEGYWETLEGSLIYAGFVGSHASRPALWLGLVFGIVAAYGTYELWRQRQLDGTMMLLTLPLALFVLYLALGSSATAIYRERFLLWAVVPSLLALGFVLQALCMRLGMPRLAPTIAFGWSVFWLVSFCGNYLRPFEATGGMSAVLCYRSAVPPLQEQVLAVIANHRQYPATDATVFVGMPGLHIALTYLASRETGLDMRNLGAVIYPHFQHDDRPELLRLFKQYRLSDVFFVDYAWEEIGSGILKDELLTDASGGGPIANSVAPWTARELQRVYTPDGRPLLKIWRLATH